MFLSNALTFLLNTIILISCFSMVPYFIDTCYYIFNYMELDYRRQSDCSDLKDVYHRLLNVVQAAGMT